MKLKEKPRIELLYKQDSLIIPFEKGQIRALHELLDSFDIADLTKEYTVKIERIRQKRSLDANAYFWKMCRELAVKLDQSYMNVYREYIRDYGVFNIVPIAEKAVDRWVENWGKNGSGWICESIGKSKIDGYYNIKCYYGSSTYDTKEMSRLIDAVVADCKEQGIETATPNEIERMMQQWDTK